MPLQEDPIWHDRRISCKDFIVHFRLYRIFLRLLLDLELVKLPEDITLAGFTPLMLNPQDPCYVEKTEDMVGYITLCKIGAFYC